MTLPAGLVAFKALAPRTRAAMVARVAPWVLALTTLAATPAPAQTLLDFSATERERILSHGPWPTPGVRDAANRVDGQRAAIDFGARLFFDPRLSAGGDVSCASCHQPPLAFQDGRRVAKGRADGIRNTPTLLDVAQQRWFGWDGAHDSLWAASLSPLLQAGEMGQRAADLAGDRQAHHCAHDGREHHRRHHHGLRLFVGEARCSVCHAGATFSNGEFADIGVPFFVPGGVDPGRHGGLQKLLASRMNRLGPHDDAGAADARAVATRHVIIEPRHFGEFRVPGLRQLVHTAPYMHDGSLASIEDVVQHYSALNEERLHADGERILRRLDLTLQQAADLAAFLRSLSR